MADRPRTDVLDVSCGPGTISIDIARRVNPRWVVGIAIVAGLAGVLVLSALPALRRWAARP
ncbi:MAG: hypothetical protein M0T80_00255 [Actinomycetota bacterium]|nr:hypothetical protein [Actinomycetota bacterium]